MSDKRHFSRVGFDAETHILYQGQRIEAHLLDISLKGALFTLVEPLSISMHDDLKLEIDLGHSGVKLEAGAELVHVHDGQLGVQFQSMGLDSLIHLRRLIELNIGDSEQVDRELEFFSKIKPS